MLHAAYRLYLMYPYVLLKIILFLDEFGSFSAPAQPRLLGPLLPEAFRLVQVVPVEQFLRCELPQGLLDGLQVVAPSRS